MSTILKRAHHVLLIAVAMVFGLTLLAPIATLANTNLVVGQQAIVDNPNGSGANLRSDITVLDESTLIAELSQGATVLITGGPVAVDSGAFYWVTTIDGAEGLVSATLLRANQETPVETETEAAAETVTAEESVTPPTSPDLLWQDPIDVGSVVDSNNEIPADGLACRASATVDGEIITRVSITEPLQVVAPRIQQGEQSFVHINCAEGAGYVNGTYVALQSEPAAEPVVTEPVVEEPEVEIPVVEEPTVEIPAVDESTTEEVTETAVSEEAIVDEPASDNEAAETVDETPVVEAPVVDAPVTEDVTSEPEAEDSVTDEPMVEEADAEDAAQEPAVAVDATPEVIVEESVETVADAPIVADEPEITDSATPEVTEEPVVTEEATTDPSEEATVTEEATEEATEEPVVEAEDDQDAAKVPAVTAPASDISKMIGSAEVTGTNGEGLRCRVSPSDDAATLMVLEEGTKVYVLAEATNGYLGIDCGGLQGFADVNFLWSGGAGDGEIQKSNMSVTVTGTGNGLNCRTGAGTNNPVITVIRDGTALKTRGAAKNGWVAVVCGGQNGFVATPYVAVSGGGGGSASTPDGSGASTGNAAVANTGGDGLNCRSGAGSSYSVITVLAPGQSVSVRGANQGAWVPVNCGGKSGFAHSDFLNVSGGGSTPSKPAPNPAPGASTGTVTVANTGGSGLNCRAGAGTGHGVITVLRLGQSVSTRSGSTSGWQAVVCGGQNGFISSDFITAGSTTKPTPEKPTTPAPGPSGMQNGDHGKTSADLNFRYDASLGAGVAAVAPAGTVVLITGAATNGFHPVDWDGLKGFLSADYLNKTSEALSQRGGSAKPEAPAPPTSGGGSATGNAMVDYAMRYLGYPYVWATHGPASFDCSGFTYWVTQNVMGKNIGYGTWTQVSAGARVSRADLQPGDLVFFQNTYTAGLSHVGLYIGGGQFVHAENETTGVRISDLDSSYYGSRWYGAVRL